MGANGRRANPANLRAVCERGSESSVREPNEKVNVTEGRGSRILTIGGEMDCLQSQQGRNKKTQDSLTAEGKGGGQESGLGM